MRSAIFYGGRSVEHEISIVSALQAYQTLIGQGQKPILVYLDKSNRMFVGKELEDKSTYINFEGQIKKLREVYIDFLVGPTIIFKKRRKRKINFDVALLLVHGYGVEDGTLSALFELLNIPYFGPSVLSGSICQDKVLTKTILQSIQIPVLPALDSAKKEEFKYPIIVKPAHLGSSIGIHVADSLNSFEDIIHTVQVFDTKILVEPYVEDMREFNIAIIGDETTQVISQIEEVHGSQEILTFNDKYLDGGSLANLKRKIPAKVNRALASRIEKYAKAAFINLECFGIVRFDFIYDRSQHKLYLNEVNSIPGSLGFYLFKDLSYGELLEQAMTLAIKRYEKKNMMTSCLDNHQVLVGHNNFKFVK